MGGEWGFLSRLLDNAQAHTTVIGKIWTMVLLVFRIMVLCGPAEGTWGDDKSSFTCDTFTPMCHNKCHNFLFPISHIRYWTFQLIFVSTPALFYLGHVLFVTHKENKLRQQLASLAPAPRRRGTRKPRRPRYTDEKGHVKIKGRLLCTYMITLVAKIVIELASVWGQYKYLSGFSIEEEYICPKFKICLSEEHKCQTSRPTEKTIVIRFMVAMAGLSMLLNVVEMLYLLCKMKCCLRRCKSCTDDTMVLEEDPNSHQLGSNAPSYNAAMLQDMEVTVRQNSDVVLEMENMMRGQRSLSGGLDGDYDGGVAATPLTRHPAPETPKRPALQPPKTPPTPPPRYRWTHSLGSSQQQSRNSSDATEEGAKTEALDSSSPPT